MLSKNLLKISLLGLIGFVHCAHANVYEDYRKANENKNIATLNILIAGLDKQIKAQGESIDSVVQDITKPALKDETADFIAALLLCKKEPAKCKTENKKKAADFSDNLNTQCENANEIADHIADYMAKKQILESIKQVKEQEKAAKEKLEKESKDIKTNEQLENSN